MNTSSLNVIKTVSWIIAAMAGLFAAWFELRDRWQTEDDRQRTRTYYRKIWQTIQQTGLLLLPEKAIAGFLTTKTALVAKARGLSNSLPDSIIMPLMFTTPVAGFVVGWFASGWILALVLSVPMTIFPVLVFLNETGMVNLPNNDAIDSVVVINHCLFWLATGLVLLKVVLSLNIVIATLVMTTLFPFYALFIAIPLVGLADSVGHRFQESKPNWFVFGMALVASFSITMISLLVGHVADSTCWVPKTMQMLGSNVIFDGLTMLATIMILTLAVPPQRRISIPFAVCLDVAVAAVFAWASLYCGVAFTDRHLGIIETARVLVALSPEGGHFEIGPYFWAMHTTFIPTLLYLILISLCWVGKLLVLPVASILSRGAVVEKPHHLTAGVFLFIAAVFGVISTGVDTLGNKTIESRLSTQESKPVLRQIRVEMDTAILP
jgi:hypothetical protein